MEPVYGVLDEVLELIDTKLSKQYNIDADRIYVLGHLWAEWGPHRHLSASRSLCRCHSFRRIFSSLA